MNNNMKIVLLMKFVGYEMSRPIPQWFKNAEKDLLDQGYISGSEGVTQKGVNAVNNLDPDLVAQLKKRIAELEVARLLETPVLGDKSQGCCLASENTGLKKRIAEMEDKLNLSKTIHYMAAYGEPWAEEVSKLKKELNWIKEQFVRQGLEVEGYKVKLDGYATHVTRLEGVIREKESKIDSLERTNAGQRKVANHTKNNLQQRLDAAEAELFALKGDGLVARSQRCEERIKQLVADLEKLRLKDYVGNDVNRTMVLSYEERLREELEARENLLKASCEELLTYKNKHAYIVEKLHDAEQRCHELRASLETCQETNAKLLKNQEMTRDTEKFIRDLADELQGQHHDISYRALMEVVRKLRSEHANAVKKVNETEFAFGNVMALDGLTLPQKAAKAMAEIQQLTVATRNQSSELAKLYREQKDLKRCAACNEGDLYHRLREMFPEFTDDGKAHDPLMGRPCDPEALIQVRLDDWTWSGPRHASQNMWSQTTCWRYANRPRFQI